VLQPDEEKKKSAGLAAGVCWKPALLLRSKTKEELHKIWNEYDATLFWNTMLYGMSLYECNNSMNSRNKKSPVGGIFRM
jgi:hypothetical protein